MENKVMTDEFRMEDIFSQTDDAKPGKVVEGVIVSQQDPYLLVDVGLKTEASLSIKEFGPNIPKVGDKLEVLIVRMNGPENRPLVSHRQARETKYWDVVFKRFENKETVDAKIIARVKGGVRVDIGLDGFMPSSQIDLRPVYKPDEWIGKTVQVKILEMNRAKGSVLVSRRQILEAEKEAKKEVTLGNINVGDVLKGTVTGIASFGAFVDIGGVEGLLHISDLAWGRVDSPKKHVKVGEEIEVKILKFDKTTHKISLGRKQLLQHPFDGFQEKYVIGTMIKGKVSGFASFGAFIEIEPGVEGLIHISEFSWTERLKSPKDILKVGQEIEAKFIGFDREKEKISLSIKRSG